MRWSYGVKILSLYFYSYSQDSNSNPELEPFSQEIFVAPFLTLTLRSLADAMARIFSSTWKSITVQLSLLVQFNIYHLNLCRKKPWADRRYETRAVCVASQNAIPWRSSRKQAKKQTHSLQIFRENIIMAAGAIQRPAASCISISIIVCKVSTITEGPKECVEVLRRLQVVLAHHCQKERKSHSELLLLPKRLFCFALDAPKARMSQI